MEVTPLTIELDLGYTDKNGKTHTAVTFGKRITGKELFAIDEDPQSSLETQYDALIIRAKITKFGDLKMPVSLQTLLELDSLDREDLAEASNKFSDQAAGDRKVEYTAVGQVKLAFGYTRNDLTYDLVEFCNRLTGMDEVAADKLRLKGIRRALFLAGRQISKLAQSDGESVLEGPFDAEFLMQIFESLDLTDVGAIRAAAEVWRYSFRRPGARVQQ